MKRVVTAVTKSQKSQLVGISYEDMLSFLSNNIDNIADSNEDIQSELEAEVQHVSSNVESFLVKDDSKYEHGLTFARRVFKEQYGGYMADVKLVDCTLKWATAYYKANG